MENANILKQRIFDHAATILQPSTAEMEECLRGPRVASAAAGGFVQTALSEKWRSPQKRAVQLTIYRQ